MSGVRLAFVVQQYGAAVSGGAETYCRVLAEHVARSPEVAQLTVFTTCSKDYRTWENAYPPGKQVSGGVTVERFETAFPRQRAVQSLSSVLLRIPHPTWLEWPWLVAQGPFAPRLLDRLQEVEREYDAFVFFTYLYHPTVEGLRRVRARKILIPTAHDERAIRLGMYRDVFGGADALGFLTEDEERLVRRLFPETREKASAVIGSGVNLAPVEAAAARSAPTSPFVLYLGRIDRRKGVRDLALHFARWKDENAGRTFEGRSGPFRGAELQLVLAGAGDRSILPDRQDLVLEGFVSEERKRELLGTCEALMMPSPHESLSLVMLEAWALGRPVVVNRACEVTTTHVGKSDGGLTYEGESEFVTALGALLSDAGRAAKMGSRGKSYVAENYTWDRVEERLLRLVRSD